MKNKCPTDEEIERTKEFIKKFKKRNGEKLTRFYLKSDVILLTCVFEKFTKVSINEFDISLLFSVSLRRYNWRCGWNYTAIGLQTPKDKDMILLFEKFNRGGLSSVMGDIYAKSDNSKKIMYIDANNLYAHSMSQPLSYDEIKIDKIVKVE